MSLRRHFNKIKSRKINKILLKIKLIAQQISEGYGKKNAYFPCSFILAEALRDLFVFGKMRVCL